MLFLDEGGDTSRLSYFYQKSDTSNALCIICFHLDICFHPKSISKSFLQTTHISHIWCDRPKQCCCQTGIKTEPCNSGQQKTPSVASGRGTTWAGAAQWPCWSTYGLVGCRVSKEHHLSPSLSHPEEEQLEQLSDRVGVCKSRLEARQRWRRARIRSSCQDFRTEMWINKIATSEPECPNRLMQPGERNVESYLEEPESTIIILLGCYRCCWNYGWNGSRSRNKDLRTGLVDWFSSEARIIVALKQAQIRWLFWSFYFFIYQLFFCESIPGSLPGDPSKFWMKLLVHCGGNDRLSL